MSSPLRPFVNKSPACGTRRKNSSFGGARHAAKGTSVTTDCVVAEWRHEGATGASSQVTIPSAMRSAGSRARRCDRISKASHLTTAISWCVRRLVGALTALALIASIATAQTARSRILPNGLGRDTEAIDYHRRVTPGQVDNGSLAIGLIGVFLSIVSPIIGYVLYRKGRTYARLSFRGDGVRLIGGVSTALPTDVTVTVGQTKVAMLSKATIVLWNSGKTTFRGQDVVEHDPLRIECMEGAQIIDCRITRVSRPQIRFETASPEVHSRSVHCLFDYLDPGDGATVELLHTGASARPRVCGTIRGLPEGVGDWGEMPERRVPMTWSMIRRMERTDILQKIMFWLTYPLTSRPLVLAWILLIAAIATFATGLSPYVGLLLSRVLSKPVDPHMIELARVGWLLMLFGLFLPIPAMPGLMASIRRVPRGLIPE
jgi:hypothetical protein